MTIYLDNAYRCHLSNDGTMTAVETERFDGKCQTYIEGYRFVPEGHIWVRNDGMTFRGEMLSPWKNIHILQAAQAEYEKMQEEVSLLQSELAELDAALLETTYNSIINEV